MSSTLNLSYNTDTNKLIIPEYGRNVQKMINHAVKIEQREERNKAAKVIIKVMDLINPNTRNNNSEEHGQKLWAHLLIISNFELESSSSIIEVNINVPPDKPLKKLYSDRSG